MTPVTVYIDMEFAGVHGTHQEMQIPIEIGMVIHDAETDSLSFAGRAFSWDITVELWKNMTDDVGKRVEGQRRVFNLASRSHMRPFDRTFRLDAEGRKNARRAIAGVHSDLKEFMQTLNQEDIGTMVFFARRRELETFHHAGIHSDGFFIRDLQDEIRSEFQLKEHISLDRASIVAEFRKTGTRIHSAHFSYILPEKYRYLIRPHKAIGDAARMFLVDREMHGFPEYFRRHLDCHIEAYERRKPADKEAREEGIGPI